MCAFVNEPLICEDDLIRHSVRKAHRVDLCVFLLTVQPQTSVQCKAQYEANPLLLLDIQHRFQL